MKREKKFLLSAEQIRPLAPGRGGCYATDRITVDGERVGYMYRESSDFGSDSGWRFFSGDESQEYVDDPAAFALVMMNDHAHSRAAIAIIDSYHAQGYRFYEGDLPVGRKEFDLLKARFERQLAALR